MITKIVVRPDRAHTGVYAKDRAYCWGGGTWIGETPPDDVLAELRTQWTKARPWITPKRKK